MMYMSYQISIPSYKRATLCNTKTLVMLCKLGIDKTFINVFVTPEDLEEYKLVLNPDYYNLLIVGKEGLVSQRQFIEEYYPAGTHLIFIDDDVEHLDLTMTDYITANHFFEKAFEICITNQSYIWGLYPVYNPFFRQSKEPITTTLKYIIGAFYGIITRPKCEDLFITLTTGGNKEDVERTLLYYLKDRCVTRFNTIGFKTKYYGKTGGLGTLQERLGEMRKASILINTAYPYLTKIRIRKNQLYEIILRDKSTPFHLNELLPDDYLDVYNLLCDTPLTKQSNKSGRARTFGEHRAVLLGYVKGRISREFNLSAETKKRPELYNAVVELGNKICPFPFDAIQINHNLECSKHIDKGNVGLSCIVSFGDYTGCDLVVDKNTYNTNCRPLIFDGGKYYHWNTPLLTGCKYSLVYFKNQN